MTSRRSIGDGARFVCICVALKKTVYRNANDATLARNNSTRSPHVSSPNVGVVLERTRNYASVLCAYSPHAIYLFYALNGCVPVSR